MLDTAAAGLVLTGEDKEIVDMVHDFVLKEVRPKAAEHDISGELDWDAYNKAFEMGLVCADLPAEYGGQGLSNVSAAWIHMWNQQSGYQAGSDRGNGRAEKMVCRNFNKR